MGNVRISVAAETYFFWAVMLLFLPLRWVIAFVGAATVHEVGHLAAIFLLRGRVYRIRIGIGGVCIETAPMDTGKELVCAAAGPVAGMLCLCVIRRLPLLGLCALCQSVFNLIPKKPLDGGRIVSCIGRMLLGEEWGNRLAECIGRAVTVILAGVCLWGIFVRGYGMFLLVLGMFLFRVAIFRKTPCKSRRKRLQ